MINTSQLLSIKINVMSTNLINVIKIIWFCLLYVIGFLAVVYSIDFFNKKLLLEGIILIASGIIVLFYIDYKIASYFTQRVNLIIPI